MNRLFPFGLLALLAACDLPPQDPELAARDFEERARAAQGPTGTVSVGVNSESGPFTSASIGLSSDYLAGRDPVAVYEQCVYQRTGALPDPVAPPELKGNPMMIRRAAVIALLAGTQAMALTPEQDSALALINPMLQEVAPGAGGQVLATCIVSLATPGELALLATATGPSAEVGAVINAVIARPETIACLQAAAGQ